MSPRKFAPRPGPLADPRIGPNPLAFNTGRGTDLAVRHPSRPGQFGALLEFSPDAIVIVDADLRVREWNDAAEQLLRGGAEVAVDAPLRGLLSSAHRVVFDEAWLFFLTGEAPATPRDSPSTLALDVTVAPIRKGATVAGAVVILRDLTEPPRSEATSGESTSPAIVEYDGPAGLPGKLWLQRWLSVTHAPGLQRGVAAFDIDTFARVLETYGPDEADSLLADFGDRLKSLDVGGSFAHWRADSFVWMVDTEDPRSALETCVGAVTDALDEPFQVGPHRVELTLNIGLATTALVADGDLLSAASDAMHSAKVTGSTTPVYYDSTMQANASSGFRLANDLHHAIANDELRLHYQPIIDFSTNEVSGVEALVRWERPGAGLLAPGFFIEVAERTGQIVPLGDWVVRKACQDAMRLGNHSGGPRTMSINISARHLADPSLIETLREAMEQGQCAPATIVIEVTESVLMDDLDSISASLDAIKALDVGVDLDDFGTGYSSLQYLRRLPVDRLKVDQGFVAGLATNVADIAIVASTIALAHALGLSAIAEGVETDEQLTLLREMGCDFAQGYLINRPADMDTFLEWLDAYVPAEVPPHARTRTAASARKRGRAAEHRDTAANLREEEADTRDITATTRDAQANTRDSTADTRELAADERERVADLRDEAALQREQVADTNEETDSEATGRTEREASASFRRGATAARRRARDERNLVAKDRERADQGRHQAAANGENDTASGDKDPDAPPL